jgi:glycosyltransferase involved in cell wall biosynthesis
VKILFISAWFPAPPDNGSKIRIHQLLRSLSQQHSVTLLSFIDPAETIQPEALSAYCRVAGLVPKIKFQPNGLRSMLGWLSPVPRSMVATYSAEMDRLVRAELRSMQYDVLIASQFDTAVYAPIDLRVPAVFEEVETSLIREAYTRTPNRIARLRRWLTWRKTSGYTRQLLKRYAACTVVSTPERDNLRAIAPEFDRVEIIPNAVDIDQLAVKNAAPEANQLVFSGALTYRANYDAMHYFLAEIWPRIKAAIPAASLKITGRTTGVPLDRLPAANDVIFTGYLPDIRSTVANAWSSVVPLRVGGGTRLKILEAMALGTPVISTSKGAEGLDASADQHLLVADDPIGFAEQTVRLLRDPALRARLAENARRLVRSKYNWQSVGQRFVQLIESIG